MIYDEAESIFFSHHLKMFMRALPVAALLCMSASVLAQSEESEDSGNKEVEELYDRTEQELLGKSRPSERNTEVSNEAHSLSDLANLAPFEDVAVIQRRFLPKTGRFELTGSVFTNLNNPFFNSMGATVRGAYYFTERWALEGLASFASTSSRQVTDDLKDAPSITTDNVVTSKGFYGAAIKWNPIYGKMTWLNKTIVPFDINFNLGAGLTQTTEDESEPTIHFGTSQVFALSKGMAFRWDLTWNMYEATVKHASGTSESVNQNDLFLGIGMSFYFPEAGYR